MVIHDIKIQYGIVNRSVLMQETICNLRRVAIIVPNRMARMRKKLLTVFTSYIESMYFKS